MRWGVRDEATDDHMTTELCMKEIENCQRLSMGPNFVVSLTKRLKNEHNTNLAIMLKLVLGVSGSEIRVPSNSNNHPCQRFRPHVRSCEGQHRRRHSVGHLVQERLQHHPTCVHPPTDQHRLHQLQQQGKTCEAINLLQIRERLRKSCGHSVYFASF